MAAIQTSRLTKTFRKGTRALDGVGISIEEGEMVALIGASGSGKSTLLRHLAGLVPSDKVEGCRIEVLGETIQKSGRISSRARLLRRHIGFVFQQFNLIGRLSVLSNVLVGSITRVPFWRGYLGLFPTAEKRRALEALGRVGIAETAMQRASTLSGGQQQRAAIARALVQGARVVLADEPIASLDPASSSRVMEMLANINRDDAITVVVSLHQVDYAIRYCPRTIALRAGKVVYDGPSAALSREMLSDLYGAEIDELLSSRSGHPGSPELALQPQLGAVAV